MFKGGLGADRLPEDDDVDHDAEAVELVFLPAINSRRPRWSGYTPAAGNSTLQPVCPADHR